MTWEVQYRNGIYLPQIDWWLDAAKPKPRSFVSHAHFDHLAKHQEVVFSPGTARLMRARLPGRRIERVLPFGQTAPLTADGKTTITLYPAGHIFGSAQCLIEHPQYGRLLYTGDFKLRPGRAAEPCATPHADVLIMETTFGRPHYVLPPTETVLADIVDFCRASLADDATPVLFGYSLGKSQEVLLSLAAANLPVMLHAQAARMTAVYEELGLTFPPHQPFDPLYLAGHVVICPPQTGDSPFLRQIPRPRTAMITGWAIDSSAIYRHQTDAVFPLSDHADFPDLLRFVGLVQPQRVLTMHGFAADFARTLRERGIEAWALGQSNQLDLALPLETPPPPSSAPLYEPSLEPDLATRWSHFATTAEAVAATRQTAEKHALLHTYFASLPPGERSVAQRFFTVDKSTESLAGSRVIDATLMKAAVLEVTRRHDGDWRVARRRCRDAGEAAADLISAVADHLDTASATATPATLADIAACFDALSATRNPRSKIELLAGELPRVSPIGAKYLLRMLAGDLRIGLTPALLAAAIAGLESDGR